jgi:hypothetical protein
LRSFTCIAKPQLPHRLAAELIQQSPDRHHRLHGEVYLDQRQALEAAGLRA